MIFFSTSLTYCQQNEEILERQSLQNWSFGQSSCYVKLRGLLYIQRYERVTFDLYIQFVKCEYYGHSSKTNMLRLLEVKKGHHSKRYSFPLSMLGNARYFSSSRKCRNAKGADYPKITSTSYLVHGDVRL